MLEKLDSLIETFEAPSGKARVWNVAKLKDLGYDVDTLPYSVRVLLENAARHSETVDGALEAAHALAGWPKSIGSDMPFMPHRVLLQDYTGVPLIVDLAAMRDAAKDMNLDPSLVNSKVPVDLVIDHSIQVDAWGSEMAIATNLEKEYERNSERYTLLKWAQKSFGNTRVFPPGKGICHQFNLEYLSRVFVYAGGNAYPDTLIGTDSHTTMVNGLGCLGWGVGGIEAEAVMLGEPCSMPVPKVVGVKFTGALREGVTPTDLVLHVTERLRQTDVVGAFVEYFGEGYSQLSVPDRATIGNMSPEYGATTGFSPVDGATLAYLAGTARPRAQVDFVERYARRFKFFVDGPDPRYSEVIVVDLGKIEPSVAGPRNPEERHALASVPAYARGLLSQAKAPALTSSSARSQLMLEEDGPVHAGLSDGAVVIAAITSCTNTSNPTVMVGAGLIAKRAAEEGLTVKPWVKPSMAPGSTVVTDYLQNSGLLPYLDRLGFFIVGYGCTSCIGNSGPLAREVEAEIRDKGLYTVAVLSGNRNFDGRIHPLVKGAFLMSPMLVVAYALAGRLDFDFASTPLGEGKNGNLVFLKDLWPSLPEIRRVVERSLGPDLYSKRYADASQGDDRWERLPAGKGVVYAWDQKSSYIRRPGWFAGGGTTSLKDIEGARILALLGDKVTTDHISPAGSIPVDSPAGAYLTARGVGLADFSTYGSRRGNHEVMVRGGFNNIRLRNALAKGKEGGYTAHLPDGEVMSVYDAAMKYQAENVPLLVVAGKQYGSGSSRDWAAKAPKMLGVRAVLAESFERIHRSNLVAMGILPLEFKDGDSPKSLGLEGDEILDIRGLGGVRGPGRTAVAVAKKGGTEKRFEVVVRVDNQAEVRYLENGGVLPYVLGKLRTS